MSDHWFASRVERLRGAVAAWETNRGGNNAEALRHELHAVMRALVDELAGRDGVTAAFVAHDGLLIEGAGPRDDLEALAAVGQLCWAPAAQAARPLGLGDVHQLVVCGAERKLVLLGVGAFTLGLTAPADVRLADRLA
jgi:predicted regulator of Ras-like GTPase activity (Roadblock/LC7/MglB family)